MKLVLLRLCFFALFLSTELSVSGQSETGNVSQSDDSSIAIDDQPRATTTASNAEVIFIDSTLADWKTLIANVQPGIEIVLLDSQRSGIDQMAEHLRSRRNIKAIHIVSHGSAGALEFGSGRVNGSDLAKHSPQLSAIGASLAIDGDILLYGCNIAADSQIPFLETLANATRSDVAASSNLTANARLGGDWTLETATGRIEASLPFTSTEAYAHALDVVTFNGAEANFSNSTLTRTINSRTLFFTGGQNAGGLGLDSGGLYSYQGTVTGDDIRLTITVDAGYTFDISSLKARAINTSLSISLTYGDGSTTSFTQGSISGASLNSVSTFNTAINDVKQVIITSNDYAIFQDIDITDVKVYAPAPTVTDANLSISGGTGTGGAFKIGDTVSASWNDTAGGDNNTGVTTVTVDFSQFGGGAAVSATNSSGTWTATYTILAGAIDAANRNISVTATNGNGPTTSADSTNATVDNVAPATPSTPNLTAAADTGSSNTDNITSDTTPTFTGSAEANVSVTLTSSVDGALGTTNANGAGNWLFTSGILTLGEHSITANATDTAGNVSSGSSGLTVTIYIPDPAISSATYRTTTGDLVVTATDLQANAGGADIDASAFTFTGEGGSTYTLTDTADVEISSATQFTLTLSATDKAAVNQILNQAGASSSDATTYNLAAADDWNTNVTAGDTSDATGNGIAASLSSLGAALYTYVSGTSVTVDYVLENLGQDTISSIVVEQPLNPVFGSGNYSITSQPTLVEGPSSLTLSSQFFGFNVFDVIISGGSLAPGETARVRTVVNIANLSDQGNGFAIYPIQYTANGQDSLADAVSDTSDYGIDPDPDGDGIADEAGENDETQIKIGDEASLGAAIDSAAAGNEFTLDYYLENLGSSALSNLTLPQDFDAVFGAGNYSITSSPSLIDDPGTITLNGSWNGSGDTAIIAGGSALASGDTAQIRLVVEVTSVSDQGYGSGSYRVQATSSATAPSGSLALDLSDSGTDPDPNGNGNPADTSESDPTTLEIPSSATTTAAAFDTTDGTNLTPIFAFDARDETLTVAAAAHLVGSTADGSGGTDTLELPTGSDLTTLASLTSFENLTLASGASVSLTPTQFSGFSGTIVAPGSETLNFSGDGNVSTVADIESYSFGDSSTNARTITITNAGHTVSATAATDAITFDTGALALTGTLTGEGAVNDTLLLANSANLSGATLSDIENLTLASGASVTMTSAQLNSFSGTITATATETITLTSTGTLSGSNLEAIEVFATPNDASAQAITLTAATAAGKSLVTGDSGQDTFIITGSSGSQTITGTDSADTIDGGDDNDTIAGGAGVDNLTGGSGSDQFVGSNSDLDGDTITDIEMGDTLLLTGITGLTTANVRFNGTTFEIDTDATTFASPEVTINTLSALAATVGVTSVVDSGSDTLITFGPPLFTVSSVTATTANGSYRIGESIDITVEFSDSVTVTGTPTLELETGSTDRTAAYSSGSGGTTLTFTYTVQTGDTASNLDYTSTAALTLAGGTIQDVYSRDATLTLASPGAANSLGDNKAIVIDTSSPTLSSISRLTPATLNTATTSIVYRATFDGTVAGVDVSDFSLSTVSGAATGTIASVSSATGTTIDVTISDLAAVGQLRLDLNASDTGITDTAGNTIADGGFTTGELYHVGSANVFDATGLNSDNSVYIWGGNNNIASQRFTTTAGNPLTLTSISALISWVDFAPVQVVTIRTDNAGFPSDTVVATFTNPASLTTDAIATWTGDVTLDPSTTYWVHFAESSGTGTYSISVSNATTGGSGSWLNSPADYAYFYRSNDSIGWPTGVLKLALGVAASPSVTSSLTASGTYGTELADYTITADSSPSSYAATGLPAGLSLDTDTGVISGTPTASGSFNVSLTASNHIGTSEISTLVLTIAKAAIEITADSDQAKVYGSSDPTFTYSITSGALIGSDEFTGSLARAAGENIGSSYAIGQGTLELSSNYTLTFVSADFAITAKPITVTADSSQSKAYGGSDPTFTYTVTTGSLETGDSLTGALTRASGENTGSSYAITQGTLAADSNYTLSFVSADFAITAKPITVTADSDQSKVYGGSDPTLTYTLTSGALESGDSLTGTLSRAAGESVGSSYAIAQNTLTAGSNYALTFDSADFAITPKSIEVTVDNGQNKVYGDADPTFTFTITTGTLVGADDLTGSLARASGENIGSSYAIGQGTLELSSNYSLSFVSADFAITAKPITVTIDSSQSKAYGGSDPTFTYTLTGSLETGDSLTGALTRTSGENVGSSYTISQGTLAANSNYSLTFVSADFEITAKPITVTADSDQSKVYGGSDPTLTYTLTSGTLESGDSLTGSLSRAAGESVGSSYAIAQNTLTAGSNYALTFDSADFAITPKSIEVTVDNGQNKVYGDADPTFTYTITTGTLVGSDEFTGELTRASGESVGSSYAIGQGTLELSSNYSLSFVSADFAITAKPITATADNSQTKVYGDSDPAFTYSITTGALIGDDDFTGALARTTGENIGSSYAITQGTLSAGSNYTLSFVSADFAITAKSITVTADNQTKVYSATDPALSYSITSGALVGSDRLSGTLARTTGEDVDTYAISQGTLLATSNYTLSFVPGDFVITKKQLTVTADDQARLFGSENPSFTATITGFAFDDTADSALSGAASFTTTANAASIPGSYPITPAQGSLETANYNFAFVDGTLTVNYTAPVITLPSTPTVAEDTSDAAIEDTLQISDLDSDNQTVSILITGGTATFDPTGLAFTIGGSVDRTHLFFGGKLADVNAALDSLTFTPTPNLSGIDAGSIRIQTSDGHGGTDDKTLTFDIVPANDAPDSGDVTITVNEDEARIITTSDFPYSDALDGDAIQSVRIDSLTLAGGTLTLSGAGVTAGQVITTTDIDSNHLVITPAANANGPNALSFTFSVSDGSDFSEPPSNFIVNVTPVNDAPTIDGSPVSVIIDEDTESTIDLSSATVEDVDDDIVTLTLTASSGTFSSPADNTGVVETLASSASITLVGLAADLNAYLDTPSNIRYTATEDLSGDNVATIALVAGDQSTSSSASIIAINISNTNDTPVTQTDLFKRYPFEPIRILISDLLANDSDPDGDNLSIVSIAYTGENKATLERDETSITYYPNGHLRVDTFQYTIEDREGARATAVVILEINFEAQARSTVRIEDGLRTLFRGSPELTYRIEKSSTLGNWTEVDSAIADEDGYFTIEFDSPGETENVFYRTTPILSTESPI